MAELAPGSAEIRPISQPIPPKKQQAKRHYGSHPYFTKRAWNVVQAYIRNFSSQGDLVLDPFGGAGVTAVEALALRRRAIHVDLAPLANFITWGVAVAPVDLNQFHQAYADIRGKTIAYSPDGKHWVLGRARAGTAQTAFGFDVVSAIPPLPATNEPERDSLIYRLAKLGRAAGFNVHVGKKEQPNHVTGERLGDLSAPLPSALAKRWTTKKVEQIDCLYVDPVGVPLYGFEIEQSTPITTGIDRFMELLEVNAEIAGRLVLVIPRKRLKMLNSILRDSHYIGHPLYMETKVGWLLYEDLLAIYESYAGRKAPSKEQLLKRLDDAVRKPKIG